FQKELQEKVKEGVKPSDIMKLKRSKSESDISNIPTPPPLPDNSELIALQQENTELKKTITELAEKL
ncbi:3506_t:CDS:1, partial [Ambispora gerdemannii]